MGGNAATFVEWPLPDLLRKHGVPPGKCLERNEAPQPDDPVRLVRLHRQRLKLRAAGSYLQSLSGDGINEQCDCSAPLNLWGKFSSYDCLCHSAVQR